MKKSPNGNRNAVVSINLDSFFFSFHTFITVIFSDLTFQLVIGGTVINSTEDSK
jgi:hypothetical protein